MILLLVCVCVHSHEQPPFCLNKLALYGEILEYGAHSVLTVASQHVSGNVSLPERVHMASPSEAAMFPLGTCSPVSLSLAPKQVLSEADSFAPILQDPEHAR